MNFTGLSRSGHIKTPENTTLQDDMIPTNKTAQLSTATPTVSFLISKGTFPYAVYNINDLKTPISNQKSTKKPTILHRFQQITRRKLTEAGYGKNTSLPLADVDEKPKIYSKNYKFKFPKLKTNFTFRKYAPKSNVSGKLG